MLADRVRYGGHWLEKSLHSRAQADGTRTLESNSCPEYLSWASFPWDRIMTFALSAQGLAAVALHQKTRHFAGISMQTPNEDV